jgi:hypothetical protein
MARAHRQDRLNPILKPLAERFAADISAAVMDFVKARVRDEVEAVLGRAVRTMPQRATKRRASAGHSNIRPCRVPGCSRQSKGPRFDFFCEVHRTMSAEEKEAVKKGKAPAAGRKAVPAKTPKSGAGRRQAQPKK